MSTVTRYIPRPLVADAVDLVHALQYLGVPAYDSAEECLARNVELGLSDDDYAVLTVTVNGAVEPLLADEA